MHGLTGLFNLSGTARVSSAGETKAAHLLLFPFFTRLPFSLLLLCSLLLSPPLPSSPGRRGFSCDRREMTMEITDSVISPSDPYPKAVSSEITEVDEPLVEPVVEGRKRTSTRGIKPADHNGEGIKEEGSMVGGKRNVDVTCVYASNPYHQCSGYCSQRNPTSRRRAARSKSESMVGVKMGEKKKVDPRCINADNPYHKCSKNCSQKSHKMGLVDRPKSEESRTVKRVEMRNVNIKCGYARNPYHTCTELCLQRIQKAM